MIIFSSAWSRVCSSVLSIFSMFTGAAAALWLCSAIYAAVYPLAAAVTVALPLIWCILCIKMLKAV
jgi:hypothetical protein